MYKHGLIGNCQINGLVDHVGALRWLCMPKPDSPPIFGSLLDQDGGIFSIGIEELSKSEQIYLKNTNILTTKLTANSGAQLDITDFAPRFEQYGRLYRPASLFRIITPTHGTPRIKVHCNPVLGWSKTPATPIRANSHLRFEYPDGTLRIVTNMPLTYLLNQESFLLQEPIYIAILWDSALEADIKQVSLDFLSRTEHYWQKWVKHCSIPSLFQEETIRSALALKLHCYEDTGAIIAATTTSLPEKIGGERNWDYRFCWLRDAFFTLSAFYHLGHFEEMEGFLRFLLNIVNFDTPLAPLYSIDSKKPDAELSHDHWAGYLNSKPVRSNNGASTQVQNDVYGELILTLAPIYLDERFHHLRSQKLDDTMFWLAQKCCESVGMQDAGIWEIRGKTDEHSFTNLMCWAGIDRTIKIIAGGKIRGRDSTLSSLRSFELKARQRILAASREGVIGNSPTDPSLDASLLLLPILRFPDDRICQKTTAAIADQLRFNQEYGSFLLRYRRCDDFGVPEEPFVICSFWMAQAFARLGEKDKGAQVLKALLAGANHLGLFAEHYAPKEDLQLGNFPQAYSHVGLVNGAFAVSPGWMDIL